MAFQVIPRELAFFDLFASAADVLVEAAHELQTMISGLSDPSASAAHAARIKELEHAGDDITHKTIALLNLTFVVPLDRDDIYELASELDDILDELDAVADLLILYGTTEVLPECRLQADVIARAAEVIALAMRAIRTPVGMPKHWVEISRLEGEGDRLCQKGIATLFAGDFRTLEVLKRKDLLERMESAIDHCEDVANAVESIALKYG